MSRRRELEQHRRKLRELREIMNSMKTLAYLETHKLTRFLDAQRAATATIESVAADFLAFYPETLPEPVEATEVYLLAGSERGFCGNFNEALLQSLTEQPTSSQPALLIGLGHKLQPLLEKDTRLVALLDGANVVEEVPTVLNRVVDTLASLQTHHPTLTLSAVFHGGEPGQEVTITRLLPPFRHEPQTPRRFPQPPLLNLPPAEFLLTLADHYLFAALHGILYRSLLSENRRRFQHLDGAVRHLDERAEELAHRGNILRQEEIIEEIEVILLNAAAPT
jgi:F-type H+-transporting ATPase subunit gamma